MSSMAEKLNKDTTSWRPQPGDVVSGVLVEIEAHEGKFGSYPLLTLETDDGSEMAVHAFHAVLRSELARKRPQPGDVIGVKFLGDMAGKGYQGYRVRVERATPAPEVDYDAMAAEAAADQIIDGARAAEPLPDEPPDYDEF